MKILFTFLLGFIFINQGIGQSPSEVLQKYQDLYQGKQAVILDERVDLHFEIVDDSLYIYEDKYVETLYLQDLASYWGDKELGYSTFSEIVDIKASTLTPQEKKYKEIKVKEFKEKDELSSSIFHDDSRYITFSFEGIQKGAITKLHFRTILKEEHLLGREFLQSFIPVLHKSYSIIADEGINVKFATFNLDKVDFTFSEEVSKGKKKYTWDVISAPEIKSESMSPSVAWYGAHVIPYVNEYKVNGEMVKVFGEPQDLFNWYNELVSSVSTEKNNPELKALADSITAGSVDELDAVRKIFYWTQDNIKYIAIEYGMGGFIPRDVNFVCQNRYGDCKDMANTITELLAYAGIESYLTWIGTTSIPYKYSEIPTPVVDNHMIATYIDKDGKYYFLDATGRYYKFGIPSAFIQGKEALIKKGENEFEIVTVPVVEPENNMISEKINISVDGNKILGKSLTEISGYHKAQFEYQIENLNPEDKVKFYKAYFLKGNNKFLPENFTEKNQYPIEEPLQLSYDFTIADYVMTSENEKYINMNLENGSIGQKIDKKREIPVQNKYKLAFENENTLEIPEGWSVDFIPEDLHIDNEFIQYDSKYEHIDDKLILRQKTTISFINMSKEHFELWNTSITKIKQNQNEVVIIKQNNE
jgi:hypothetical protein